MTFNEKAFTSANSYKKIEVQISADTTTKGDGHKKFKPII